MLARTQVLIIAILGILSIIIGGLVFEHRDPSLYIAYTSPIVAVLIAQLAIAHKQDTTAAKVDNIQGQVNGKLDAKFTAQNDQLQVIKQNTQDIKDGQS